MKNRWKELGLAELHYNAAIVALSSPQSPTEWDSWSPSSLSPALSSPYSHRRAGSMASDRSAASSATSLGDNDDDYLQMSPMKPHHSRAANSSQDSTKDLADASTSGRQTTVISTSTSRPQTPQQFYFSANIASFVRMLDRHLANVREQKHKTSVPTVRFTMPSPRPSPTKATSHRQCSSVDSLQDDEAAMDAIRQRRRNIKFRPRFDPTSVQRLCNEALAELCD